MFKNKCLYLGVILLLFTAAYAWADVNFQAADMNHWEQNSVRPIRVILTPTITGKVVGLDAYVKYNFPSGTQVFQTPSVTNFVTGLTMDNNMAYEAPPANLPSSIKFSAAKGTSDPGWSVTNGTNNNVCDLTFTINSGAPAGATTLGWRTPAQIGFSGSTDGNPPYSSLTGTANTQNIVITSSSDPAWIPSNVGINSVGTPVTSPNTGNMLQIAWDKTQVSDDTPYGITATTWDPTNLKFKVYRKRSDEGSYTLMTTTAQGTTSYNDGNADGQYAGVAPNGEPYDCCPPHNYTYTYRLHAVDNSITPREDQNTDTSAVIKCHDYTAPGIPTSSSQGGAPSMFWTTDNGTTWQGPTNSFTGYVPGDKSVTLKWGAPAASDLAGYVVIGSDTVAWGSAALGSASGDINGPNYGAGNSVGSNGTVLATQAATSLTRTKQNNGTTDLQNGVSYYYNVSAYDLAEQYDGALGAGQQGRNYSGVVQIVAIPGVSPSNAASFGTKTASGVNVTWTNPAPSDPSAGYYDGVRLVVKKGSAPSNPGDIGASGAVIEIGTLSANGQQMSHLFAPGDFAGAFDLSATYYVTIYTFNKAADMDHRRYSSGQAVNFDTTAPGQVSFLYAMPETDTSLRLNWFNPSSSNLSGVVVLRKPGTSEFVSATSPFSSGTLPTAGAVINGDEVVAYVGSAVVSSAEGFSDTGITKGQQYYYRAWAYSQSLIYSDNYDSTGSVPGGGVGGGGGGFVGSTQIIQGWNIIASGQAAAMLLNNSNLLESGAQAGDQLNADVIYQQIPGTTNYNKAYLSLSGSWIDVSTGIAPTWTIDPDRGYFYKRRSASSFSWGLRPKP